MNTQLWQRPATIERNNFVHKSLSSWSYNIAIGCAHKCRFCYVPEVSTNRMAAKLAPFGVTDPDGQWGDYVFPRTWDRSAFLASLHKAEGTPASALNADGNRAVMLCTTTDPYQTLGGKWQVAGGTNTAELVTCNPSPSPDEQMRVLVREALELLLMKSSLRVRILTRSPLARRDFDLMKLFGERLMFGMSLPTLNNQLARIYEPNAPAPSQRLATLKAAQAEGIPVFVAVAPVYPECDYNDMRATLEAVKELNPHTIYMEPINIRADNVERIAQQAHWIGGKLKTDVFATKESWRKYALEQMLSFEECAKMLGIGPDVLHLWPDKSLGSQDAVSQFKTDEGYGPAYESWLNQHWNKISAWPTL